MKYIALIYTSGNGGNALSEDEQKAVFAEYLALSRRPAYARRRPARSRPRPPPPSASRTARR